MTCCFLNVFKPEGITSFDVIYKLRKRLGIKKIGHSGTLDPLASGVMQIAVGQATRCLEYLGSDKRYIAKLRFGFFSSTGDGEGEIVSADEACFSESELLDAIKSYEGEIEQTPPVYSAIKVGGKKLYDIARKNEKLLKKGMETIDVKIPTRSVTIYEAKLLNIVKDCNRIREAEIEIFCSKGTYIRTFAVDLAKKLGTGAYLTSLVRTQAGSFRLENSVKIEDVNLQNDGIPPHLALNLPVYELTLDEFKKVKNGVKISCRAGNAQNEGKNIMLIFNDELVSVASLSDNMLVLRKVF